MRCRRPALTPLASAGEAGLARPPPDARRNNSARAAIQQLHMPKYHDLLVADMGFNVCRKSNWLFEMCAPPCAPSFAPRPPHAPPSSVTTPLTSGRCHHCLGNLATWAQSVAVQRARLLRDLRAAKPHEADAAQDGARDRPRDRRVRGQDGGVHVSSRGLSLETDPVECCLGVAVGWTGGPVEGRGIKLFAL